MDPYLVTLLLLTTGDVQAAVRVPAGQVYVTTLPNTRIGVAQFHAWAGRTTKLGAKGHAHSCFASQNDGDSPLYDSPFFRLAYGFKGNTAVWAEPVWEVAVPGVAAAARTAESMLAHCSATIGRR